MGAHESDTLFNRRPGQSSQPAALASKRFFQLGPALETDPETRMQCLPAPDGLRIEVLDNGDRVVRFVSEKTNVQNAQDNISLCAKVRCRNCEQHDNWPHDGALSVSAPRKENSDH
jgi:hypothetical protein